MTPPWGQVSSQGPHCQGWGSTFSERTVHVKVVPTGKRAQVTRSAPAIGLDAHQRQLAGRVGAVVGGLDVERHEGPVGGLVEQAGLGRHVVTSAS